MYKIFSYVYVIKYIEMTNGFWTMQQCAHKEGQKTLKMQQKQAIADSTRRIEYIHHIILDKKLPIHIHTKQHI